MMVGSSPAALAFRTCLLCDRTSVCSAAEALNDFDPGPYAICDHCMDTLDDDTQRMAVIAIVELNQEVSGWRGWGG